MLFPVGAGVLMDQFGVGMPFWMAGILVLATIPLTGALAGYLVPVPVQAPAEARISAADVTGEIPVVPRTDVTQRTG